jgi:hypothetical protein
VSQYSHSTTSIYTLMGEILKINPPRRRALLRRFARS